MTRRAGPPEAEPRALPTLRGFDALNLSTALERLLAARTSLEAVNPKDVRLSRHLERLRAQLAALVDGLRQLQDDRP